MAKTDAGQVEAKKRGGGIHKVSSRSSTGTSLANLDSSVPFQWTPFVTNMNKTTKSQHRFRADLSDRVSIPKRGTSSGSYDKREQEHDQLLEEIDSLFPC